MTQQMISPQGTPAHNGSAHPHAAGVSQVAPQGQHQGQHQGQPLGGPAGAPQHHQQQPQPQQRTFAPVGGPPAAVPMVPAPQPPAQPKESFFSAHKREILIGTGAAIFGAMFLGNTGKMITDVATSATNARRNQQG